VSEYWKIEEADAVRPVLPVRGEHALERMLRACEAGVVVAVDEVAREREVEVGVFAARLRREEDAFADRSVAVVAEEQRVIAVVREDAHAPVVRLLTEPHDAERKPVLCIQPPHLHVAEAVVLVARRHVGVRVARLVVGDDEPREHVHLTHDLEEVLDLEARRHAEPVMDEVVLAERLIGEPGLSVDRARRRDEREASLGLVAELVFAVDEEAVGVLLRGGDLSAARVQDETREVAGYVFFFWSRGERRWLRRLLLLGSLLGRRTLRRSEARDEKRQDERATDQEPSHERAQHRRLLPHPSRPVRSSPQWIAVSPHGHLMSHLIIHGYATFPWVGEAMRPQIHGSVRAHM
jgi:hypothetical protein